MNNNRRNALDKIFGKLEELKSELDGLAGEEQDAFDNMTEGLQASERGERIQECAEYLSNAVGSIESAMEDIESAKE